MIKTLLAVILGFATFIPSETQKRIADDPYAPLKLYEGKWDATTTAGDKTITHLENHCTATGRFFMCEQKVNGKTEALIVFLPIGSTGPTNEKYKTAFLNADATPSGGWNDLTIDSDRWVYSWEDADGNAKVYWRNINTFSGASHIHYEIQRSDDGITWKTVKRGDEVHVP
jgi:hypothetical protein